MMGLPFLYLVLDLHLGGEITRYNTIVYALDSKFYSLNSKSNESVLF